MRTCVRTRTRTRAYGCAQVYQCGEGLFDEEPLEAAGVALAERSFDVVLANILRGPLIELQPRLAG